MFKNFRCIWKITDEKVLNILSQMPKTEATIICLRLMRSVLKAYVMQETTVQERIFHAVYSIHFIRIWRQWLHNSKISVNHFITQNSWEGLELNLILLIKLALENNAENIYFFNSQENESFFRLLRSYTGMESMVVNCSMKGFISRVHKLQLEELLMQELGNDKKLLFPKLLSREKHISKSKANLSREQIEEICQSAINMANNESSQIGMTVSAIQLENFLKKADNFLEINPNEDENDPEDEIQEDFLNSANDVINEQNLNELTTDEQLVDENYTEEEAVTTFQNITLTNLASGIFYY